jgi:hypothetical protein
VVLDSHYAPEVSLAVVAIMCVVQLLIIVAEGAKENIAFRQTPQRLLAMPTDPILVANVFQVSMILLAQRKDIFLTDFA